MSYTEGVKLGEKALSGVSEVVTEEIFISYAHQDEQRAQRIAHKLNERKIRCFLAPKGIQKGDAFKERLREALANAREIWVLLSPDSLRSEWVTTEWGAAWVLEKRIVPVLYRCSPDDLPDRLRDLQFADIDEIDTVIDEYLGRRQSAAVTPSVRLQGRQATTFLFDIDGTVLDPIDSLDVGTGRLFMDLLSKFATYGDRFVFITGNDYDIQRQRVLEPILKRGLGGHVFCFSDGGSRAFDYSGEAQSFLEIESYSAENVMTSREVESVSKAFDVTLARYLERPANDALRRPHIRWRERTLDHIDIEIYPLRPSFRRSPRFEKFCDEVEPLFRDPSIRNASFELIRSHPGALIIRAHGKTPDFDSSTLQNLISRHLMFKEDYCELSKPELEKRGGEVVCQIALKPFNDDQTRAGFRTAIADSLQREDPGQFSVLLGGLTTIDIQRASVDKKKAIRLLRRQRELEPASMIYFGNEFLPYGNDRCVAEMPDSERPAMIVNVGQALGASDPIHARVLDDCNGPRGTVNYLSFLLHQLQVSRNIAM
jgi:hydroxymethylpyrimidine pyrophosphatase-like HAD family hydrolase